jgi:pimeloyl-ACP methyl ester carboxylesterase
MKFKLAASALTAWLAVCYVNGTSAQEPQTKPPSPDQSLLPYGESGNTVLLPGGRQIHIVCMGKGSPTVIMTAGLGDWGATWNRVQPAIAKTTRACAWDRAGFGFSAPSPERQTVDHTTSDLERALVKGGIRGPYIVVGHSLGGYESLLFADRHPREVVGMVLVDPAYPDQTAINSRIAPEFAAFQNRWSQGGAVVARRCGANLKSGKLRVGRPDPDSCLDFPPEFPASLRRRSERLYINPGMWETSASLFENFEQDSQMVVKRDRNYGNMPLIVLTAGMPLTAPPGTGASVAAELPAADAEWQRQHDRIAGLSTRGLNRRVAGSQHGIQQMKPQAVIDAISEVVREARSARPNQRR